MRRLDWERLLLATVAVLSGSAVPVHAHMPLARGLAVSAQGHRMAVRLPDFGWVLQIDEGPPAYLCDALVGVMPSQTEVPWIMRPDGSLVVGTRAGIKHVDPQGCPEGGAQGPLEAASIAALSQHPVDPGAIYAVTAEESARVFRSRDGGETFAAQGALPRGLPVSGLLLDPGDPSVLYVTQAGRAGNTHVSWSRDSGATWSSGEHAHDLLLLHAFPRDGGLLGLAHVATGVGATIVLAEDLRGPFRSVLDVRFFGGFVALPNGEELWIGDEAGGLSRSRDGGATFTRMAEDAVACLAYGGDALWGCTPGLPEQSAVARAQADPTELKAVFALADVDRMVECEDHRTVDEVCGAAWREWQADVRGAAPASSDDASTPASPEPTPSGLAHPDAGTAGQPDGARTKAPPDMPTPGARPPSGSSCHARSERLALGNRSGPAWLMLALMLVATRKRRVARLSCGPPRALRPCPPMSTDPRENDGRSDDELIARARRGDVSAFGALYDRHAPRVLALARRMLPAAEASDLLQDVFIEAWRNVRSFDPERGGVRTWLLVRARSRALDRIGRLGRERVARQVLKGTAAAHLDHRPGPGMEGKVAIRDGLLRLDTEVRTTLELTHYAGLTALEISRHMGVPVGTVRSRLARGLRQLEALLRQYEGHDS